MHRGRVMAELFLGDFIACSTVMLRRAALDDVGMFRSELKIAEEYDLFLRLADNYEFEFCAESLMRWRMHQGNASAKIALGRQETSWVLSQALARRPDLEQRVGSRAVRIRAAGFSCSMRQAHLLSRPIEAIRQDYGGNAIRALIDLPKPLLAYLISLFPVRANERILKLWALLRWRRATR
jgi:hypothetical protein